MNKRQPLPCFKKSRVPGPKMASIEGDEKIYYPCGNSIPTSVTKLCSLMTPVSTASFMWALLPPASTAGPSGPAKTPRRSNCAFYRSAAAAERAGYRPCLRCRPELAPGQRPDRLRQAPGRCRRRPHRRWRIDGEEHCGTGGRTRHHRPASAPCDPGGVRRLPHRVGPDAAPAACQTPAHGLGPPCHRGGLSPPASPACVVSTPCSKSATA